MEANANGNISFVGAGTVVLPNAPNPNGYFGTFFGFTGGDKIDLNTLLFNSSYKAIATNSGPSLETLVIAPDGDITKTVAIAGHFSGQYVDSNFVLSDDGHGGTLVTGASSVCYCRGTLILTAAGEVPVEELAVGDQVKTLSGAMKPIVWIGCGRDLVTRSNKLARPVIVRRGALADNVPHRDLYLTHGHALLLDGALIPVENLVNHRSIVWDETARVVEYYHIELADHDVVLANGAPAESYYDANNRAQFHNTRAGSAAGAAKPTFAPVLTGGDAVDQVWTKLFERAGGNINMDTTDDPDVHLVVGGERLGAATITDCLYTFALDTPPAGALHLRSHSGVPSLLGITAHDHRRLGVAIKRIVLCQAGVATTFDCEAPLFLDGGCHSTEGGYCWTDGDLALPAGLFAHLTGGFLLSVHVERPGMRYPVKHTVAMAA